MGAAGFEVAVLAVCFWFSPTVLFISVEGIKDLIDRQKMTCSRFKLKSPAIVEMARDFNLNCNLMELCYLRMPFSL